MSKYQRDREDANRIIEKAWTVFRHDELKRTKTYPEMIAALRRLKTKLTLQLKATKHLDWIENTAALIDLKIDELIALDEAESGKTTAPAAPKKPAKKGKTIWLPEFVRRKIKPPEAN